MGGILTTDSLATQRAFFSRVGGITGTAGVEVVSSHVRANKRIAELEAALRHDWRFMLAVCTNEMSGFDHGFKRRYCRRHGITEAQFDEWKIEE